MTPTIRLFSKSAIAFLVFGGFCLGQDRLEGFRKAPPLDDPAPKANALLDQAHLAVASASLSQEIKHDVMRTLVDVRRGGSASLLQYIFGGQLATLAWQQFLSSLESARTDEQKGAAQSGGGSTSLVSKPGAPAILSAAVEAGALTQSTSTGPQTTIQGNLVGVGRLLLGQDQFPLCYNLDPKTGKAATSCSKGIERALKPFSFSVSLDPSGQKTVNVPISGVATAAPATTATPASVNLPSSTSRVSGWSARYALRNPHALDSQKNRDSYFAALSTPGAAVAASQSAFFQPDTSFNDDYVAWRDNAIKILLDLPATTTAQQFDDAFSAQLDALVVVLKKHNPRFQDVGLDAWQKMEAYYGGRELALDALAEATLFTVEYTHSDPLNQPSISTFRFIGSWQASKTMLLTGNLTTEIYNSLPQGVNVSRFRDSQASVQLDLSLPEWKSIGTPVISAAGYFQYQNAPALINITNANLAPGTDIPLPAGAATVLGQKGNIFIAQLKFTLPFKATGVSFPIGVTWSNRTELIQANDIRGHIGISFDLDSLFTKQAQPATK